MLSKYNLQTWWCTTLTFNTLSYVQRLPKLEIFFPSLGVLDKLKAQPVSKRPIHKGEKMRQRLWWGGPVKNLCWPSHPSAHLSLTTVHWYIPLVDLWEKKNVTVEWAFDKIVGEILGNKSRSLHPGCRLLSHSHVINKRRQNMTANQ